MTNLTGFQAKWENRKQMVFYRTVPTFMKHASMYINIYIDTYISKQNPTQGTTCGPQAQTIIMPPLWQFLPIILKVNKSELSPLYNYEDNLITGDYRPLSILPSLSKNFEKIFNQQLYNYFKHILSGLLSTFCKKCACHHVLTRLLKDCKKVLDEHMHVGLLLLDLSKAFDCLPHK